MMERVQKIFTAVCRIGNSERKQDMKKGAVSSFKFKRIHMMKRICSYESNNDAEMWMLFDLGVYWKRGVCLRDDMGPVGSYEHEF